MYKAKELLENLKNMSEEETNTFLDSLPEEDKKQVEEMILLATRGFPPYPERNGDDRWGKRYCGHYTFEDCSCDDRRWIQELLQKSQRGDISDSELLRLLGQYKQEVVVEEMEKFKKSNHLIL